MEKILPENVVQRLSKYRQLLTKYQYTTSPYIYSTDLARVLKTTRATVRRDFMLIGCHSDSLHNGYNIRIMINRISEQLDYEDNRIVNVAVIGNNKCITDILLNDYSGDKLNISGIFDFNIPEKNQKNDDFNYYYLNELNKVIEEKNITIAIINISSEYAEHVAKILINSNISGIINFSPFSLSVPQHVFLEEINVITLLEKAVYFQKNIENEI